MVATALAGAAAADTDGLVVGAGEGSTLAVVHAGAIAIRAFKGWEAMSGWGSVFAAVVGCVGLAAAEGCALAALSGEPLRGVPDTGGTSPEPGDPTPGKTVPCCRLP